MPGHATGDDGATGRPDDPDEAELDDEADPGDFGDLSDLGGLSGLAGLGGLGDLLAQFQSAEQRLEEAAAEASATVVTGSAGGGDVTIQISGDLEAVSVHIDPAVVDPSDAQLLEDLVLAAVRDALAQIGRLQAGVAEAVEGPTLDLSGLLGNLGLGDLGFGHLGGSGGLGDLGGESPLGSDTAPGDEDGDGPSGAGTSPGA